MINKKRDKSNKFIDRLWSFDAGIHFVENLFGKSFQYASMGRFGIYHILKSIDHKNFNNRNVMMPVYACNSIASAILKAGYVPVYYDISSDDLNGDINSIEAVYNRTHSKVLILPSLYGNPADLIWAQEFCKKNDIFLIDDAAQAFGAKLDEKMVGTYGNAGLFSFSSGKPTLGHMGCYFWCENSEYKIDRTHHWLYHKLAYVNFFYNRYADYNGKRMFRVRALDYFRILLYKLFDISNDDICKFEIDLLANICLLNLNELKEKRQVLLENVVKLWADDSTRVLTPVRGDANNIKIVIIAKDSTIANKLLSFFREKDIYATRGYRLLDNEDLYPIAKSMSRRIIEIHFSTAEECISKVLCACKEWKNV